MFLRGALGAALLAMPLTGIAGQSASQHDPPASPAGDSSGGHHIAWVAAAGAAGAAVFTTFVRLSEQDADADADRGLTLPDSPVPNHYTAGSLPGNGASPGGQYTTAPSDSQSHAAVIANDPGPIVVDQPKNPDDQGEPGSNNTFVPTTNTTGGDPTNQTHPPYKPPVTNAVLVTTAPEPESMFLLGSGLIPLIPVLRRRRSAA